MSSSFPLLKSFLYVSLQQRALRLEIAANLSFISWLKLFRPEGIDMQTRWFSYRSADQAFIQKALAPFLIHFYRSHNDPPVNVPCERLAPLRLHRSKHAWIRPNPDFGMDGQMSPLRIFTLQMKVTGDPSWGGQVSSLRREKNGCLRTACQFASHLTGHCMGAIRHGTAGGQRGSFFKPQLLPGSYIAYCNAYCMSTQMEMNSLFFLWNFTVHSEITTIYWANFYWHAPCSTMFLEH